MLRITGGEFRGRAIHAPASSRTRPTQAKLRQALFNSLQATIPGAKALDLFAGSGALGFEALSRGATQVVFVESAKSVCKLIEKNATTLKVEDRIEIICDTAEQAWKRVERFAPFDLVMADPPYAGDWELRLFELFPWKELLVPGGYYALEWGSLKGKQKELPEHSAFLVKVREKNYADSVLTTYQRTAEGEPNP